jgi:hypothetical protein
MKWRLRFRLGYLKRYGWSEKFAFGFLLGPLLFYKTGHMVYVRKLVDREAIERSYVNLMSLACEDAKEELFRAIPYDFGFMFIETYSDYDIDFNRYRLLVEGIPIPKKE